MLLPPLLLLLCAAILSAVVAATAALLLPAIVRRMTKFGCCWFIESDPSVLFLFIQTRFIFYVPLDGTVASMASISLHLGNYGHARTQGGRQPAAAKPALYNICIYTKGGSATAGERPPWIGACP